MQCGFFAAAVTAEIIDFKSDLPILCVPNSTCWVVNYVDNDFGPNVADYQCGGLSYNGHKGTDFAIRTLKEMRNGIPVLSVSKGIVRAVRDGMPDSGIIGGSSANIKGKECGNGVVIEHAGGWVTQYCHLRKGSVRVKKGQYITSGHKIGLVGLSGKTEFPHVHFAIRHNGIVVDPFIGLNEGSRCQLGKKHIWSEAAINKLKYNPPYIYLTGFHSSKPEVKLARQGIYEKVSVSRQAPAIVFWADIFGIKQGDIITMHLIGPLGRKLAVKKKVIKASKARYFTFLGKKRNNSLWPSGSYEGEIIIESASLEGQAVVSRIERTLNIKQIF